MDIIPKWNTAHSATCNGCVRTDTDIMLAFMTKEEEFYDIFLTEEQAIHLISRVNMALDHNKRDRAEKERGTKISELP